MNAARRRFDAMEWVASVVALLAVLFLVSRGLPGRQWPAIIALTLAVIVAVVLLERSGLWPQAWRTR